MSAHRPLRDEFTLFSTLLYSPSFKSSHKCGTRARGVCFVAVVCSNHSMLCSSCAVHRGPGEPSSTAGRIKYLSSHSAYICLEMATTNMKRELMCWRRLGRRSARSRCSLLLQLSTIVHTNGPKMGNKLQLQLQHTSEPQGGAVSPRWATWLHLQSLQQTKACVLKGRSYDNFD